MNKNLNLCNLLLGCPEGTKLYCPFLGDVTFLCIIEEIIHIKFNADIYIFFSDGTYTIHGECMLFPSKEQRDWSKFKAPIEKFNPEEFKPFDKVLIRDGVDFKWAPNFFEAISKEPSDEYSVIDVNHGCSWRMCVPYNDDTKHLLRTYDDCPDYYKWWEK